MSRKTKECKPSTSRTMYSFVSQMDVDSGSDGEHSNENNAMAVTNFVKYIINNSVNKFPIKKNELVKNLGISQKMFLEVYNEGKLLLEDIYGLTIAEVSEVKSTRCFITYPTFKVSPLMLNSEAATDTKVLFIVLSYIFMKSGEIQEVNLNNFLEKLNINMDEFNKAKEKFVRQLYLKRRKVELEGKNEHHMYFSWGERALAEFNKKDILETVAKLINKPAINFIVQYREAFGEDPNELQDQDTVMVG